MTLGIDIGGANLKLADASGRSQAIAFPMWTEHGRLGETLRALIVDFEIAQPGKQVCSELAITMTGELADCFETRREGVRAILEHVAEALPDRQIWVYAVGGQWLSPELAIRHPWRVASSNWYALAEWALRSGALAGQAVDLIIDAGSTTVDLIPIAAGQIATAATTDRQRMQLSQLVYSGVQRTPIAAIVRSLNVDNTTCPVMAERFATSDDAYIALGLVSEMPEDCDSADGRPRTVDCARSRLARMLGEDSETLSSATIDDLARQVVNAQAAQVARAALLNLIHAKSQQPKILLSGHARPLLEKLASQFLTHCQPIWLDELTSPIAARCGPALAVAWLLEQSISRGWDPAGYPTDTDSW